MRAQELVSESGNTITLNDLYNGDFPDRDETFWDYVRTSDLDNPLTIHSMPRHMVVITMQSQYRVEHLDEILDMMDEDQQEILQRYINDPQLSEKIILTADGRVIDGNHRALAAAMKGVSIHYVDLAELDDLEEGWRDAVAAGAMALGMAGAPAQAVPASPTPQVQQAVKHSSSQLENILAKTAKEAGMKNEELAQFLAQTKHESWDFNKLKEKPQGKNYFNKYDPKHSPRTAKILGNKKAGDGERFKGRGFIQLTGRENYQRASNALNMPLVQNPELASDPAVAAKIAVWYWNMRVKPHVQDFTDTTAVTKKINPALRGLKDRHENFLAYLKAIKPQAAKLSELAYPGNIGVMEMVKFYKIASPEQRIEMKTLLAQGKKDQAWTLLKTVTGVELTSIAEAEYGTKASREIYKKLKAANYELLGQGADATVWAKDQGSVIKILMPDSGQGAGPAAQTFFKFYEFCVKNKKFENLPRFVEIRGEYNPAFTVDGKDYVMIGMERLAHIPEGSFTEALVWMLSDLSMKNLVWSQVYRAIKNPGTWKYWSQGLPTETVLEIINSWSTQDKSTWARLFTLMTMLYKSGKINKLAWDLHTENAMMRGDTVVIVDPWFNDKLG